MINVRLLHLVEYEDGENAYFEKTFTVAKQCLDLTIIDEDGSYEPDSRYFDAASGEVIWVMETDSCGDQDQFDECVEDLKGNGWRPVENLPPRLKDLFE